MIGTVDGAFAVDSMLISRFHGIVAFDIVESEDCGDYQKRQDDIYNKVNSFLAQYFELIEKRDLLIKPVIITVSSRDCVKNSDEYPIVKNILDSNKEFELIVWNKSEYYKKLNSVLQNITTIRIDLNEQFKMENK